MLRRSLFIFLGFCFLALALTVGYAVTGLSGPETTIREAKRALAQRRPQDALRILGHAEQSIGAAGRPTLRRQILEIRSKAHLQTKNYVRARIDLEQLAEKHKPGHLDTNRELVRVLILSGEPEKARSRAIRLLGNHPDDGRLRELAGEASQKIYQDKLRILLEELATKLPPVNFREASDALLPYLYRRESDPLGQLGKRQFEQLLETYATDYYTAGDYKPLLAEIRTLIAETQRDYRRCLELPGTPVAAYNGLAFALAQGKRIDDRLALSEAYLRRFDHIFTFKAATNVLQAHMDAGRYAAVVEFADRFLPPGTWRERKKARKLSSEVGRIFALKSRCLYAMKDLEGLKKLNLELAEIVEETPYDLEVVSAFAQAYEKDLEQDSWGVSALLSPIRWRQELWPEPATGPDLYLEAMQMRMSAMSRIADRAPDPVVHFDRVLKPWMDVRPADPEPLLLRTRNLVNFAQVEEALHSARKLFTMVRARHRRLRLPGVQAKESDDLDEEALRLLAGAADLTFKATQRDARSMLDQCLELDRETPRDIADPVMYLPLARLALDEGHTEIGLACAQRAIQEYLWARWPRYLWAEAMMRPGRFAQVAQKMETLHELHPDDPKAMQLVREARRKAGQSNDEYFYDVAMLGEPDAELAMGLVRKCIAREDWEGARAFAEHAVPAHGTDPEIPLLVAATLERIGDLDGAMRVLAPWLGFTDKVDREVAGRVLEQHLRLIAHDPKKRDVTMASASAAANLHREDAAALLRMADLLASHGHNGAAYEMLRPVLEDPVHRKARSGEHYLLAGKLALSFELFGEAEEHLTAALGFDDAAEASKLLALVMVRDERTGEAENAYWEMAPTDQAGAALAQRLGRPAASLGWIQSTLQENRTDLGATCLLALADPDSTPPEPVREIAAGAPELLLELLMFTELEPFRRDALARATQLYGLFPENAAAACFYAREIGTKNVDRALSLLIAATEKGGFLPAFDEMVRLLEDVAPTKLEQPPISNLIQELVQTHGAAAPPRLRVVAFAALVKKILAKDKPSKADCSLLAKLWLQHPDETGVGTEQVEKLIELGYNADAISLMDLVDERTEPAQRRKFLQWYAITARKLMAALDNPELETRIHDNVRSLIAKHGAYGGLVHFHIDRLTAAASDSQRMTRDALVREKQLLEQHLAFFAEGADPDVPALAQTLRRLITIDGVDRVIEYIEQLLRGDPSLVPIWVLRARLLEQLGEPDEALEGLRWLFHYVSDPEVVLEVARIAGQAGIATAEDEERLIRLDAELAKTPAAALARGLLAYRMGRYDEATDYLERAEERPDGAHLYFRALSFLAIPGDDAAIKAAGLLREFETGYPDSSLSEMAGHIASQLELPPEASVVAPDGVGLPETELLDPTEGEDAAGSEEEQAPGADAPAADDNGGENQGN